MSPVRLGHLVGVEFPQPFAIGDPVDAGDRPGGHGEHVGDPEVSTGAHTPRPARRAGPGAPRHRFDEDTGHGASAEDLPRCTSRNTVGVGPERDVGVEQGARAEPKPPPREAGQEVTAADHRPLPGRVAPGSGPPPGPGAGPAGELAGGGGRALDHRRDLVEGDVGHVVQDGEHQAFSRGRVSRPTSGASSRPSQPSAPGVRGRRR